jgi:hypothetical protein
MGIYTVVLYSDNPNSIASTINSIIRPLQDFGFRGTIDKTEAMTAFSILLAQRAQAAMLANVTQGNYLLDTGMNVINGMYEECFIVDTDKYKLDLPLFVYTAMFLESSIKREDLKTAYSDFKQDYFECIYKICKQSYPLQIQFTTDEAIDAMSKFNTFLLQRYSR